MTVQTPPPQAGLGGREKRLTSLLQLQADARAAETSMEFAFLAVNQTQRLLPYATAFLWSRHGRKIEIEAVSGVSEFDKEAPLVNWLRRLGRTVSDSALAVDGGPFEKQDIGDKSVGGAWERNVPPHALALPLPLRGGRVPAGLILFRPAVWSERDVTLGMYLADAYGHAWSSLLGSRSVRPRKSRLRRRLLAASAIAAIVALMAMPVRQSVVAPAEVVAKKPAVVAAPASGVIKSIAVAPNMVVRQGQPLFRLDDTEALTKYEVARRSFLITKADLRRISSRAFADAESKGEIELLRRRLKLRQAEIDHYGRLLKRMVVRAPRDGIIIFSDRNDWIGRPVSLGERIMIVAAPKETILQVWVPAAEATSLKRGADVSFYLNIAPLRKHRAVVVETSYRAEFSPAKVLSYRLKARFADDTRNQRIGLLGTAKVYGGEVSLFYFMMRRPIAILRRTLGL